MVPTASLFSELPIVVDLPQFILKYSAASSYAELMIRDGVVYDEQVARKTRQLLIDANQKTKYRLLVHAEGFFRVTRKVRKLGATMPFSSHLAAVSFFTNNASLALLGELYNKINKPAVPTRVFSSREQAEEWLAGITEAAQVA
jgi:hypothetical protein